jgi:site-specific DNA recombinase
MTDSRLGCSNHVERGNRTNRRTVAREVVLRRVLVGLKERLLAPELVEEFARRYVAEVNAANLQKGVQRVRLEADLVRLDAQIARLIGLIKDGHGGVSMAREVQELERRREVMAAELAATERPEPMPVLHPNLPELYRRRVEALEIALRDEGTALAATEVLRLLVDAVLVTPGEAHGEVHLALRGDLAMFLELAEAEQRAHAGAGAPSIGSARSGHGRVVLGSWDAGTGFEPVTFRL